MPVGGVAGRIIKLGGKLPVKLEAGAYYNVVTPQFGARWQLLNAGCRGGPDQLGVVSCGQGCQLLAFNSTGRVLPPANCLVLSGVAA